MKYNKYETVIVIRTDITEDTIDGFHTKVFDTCKKLNGFEVKFEVWGKRKLAYEIKKSMKGIYIYYLHLAPPAAIEELERSLRLNDAVLRFLTVQLAENISPDDYELTSEEEISKKRVAVKVVDEDSDDADSDDDKADATEDKGDDKADEKAEEPAVEPAAEKAVEPVAEKAEEPADEKADEADAPAATPEPAEADDSNKTDA
jgi:small subunit ribosomal protein S6